MSHRTNRDREACRPRHATPRTGKGLQIVSQGTYTSNPPTAFKGARWNERDPSNRPLGPKEQDGDDGDVSYRPFGPRGAGRYYDTYPIGPLAPEELDTIVVSGVLGGRVTWHTGFAAARCVQRARLTSVPIIFLANALTSFTALGARFLKPTPCSSFRRWTVYSRVTMSWAAAIFLPPLAMTL